MFTCVKCPLEVTLRHLNLLQGVQTFLSTSQSLYLDVFEFSTLCLSAGVVLWVLNDTAVSDRNSDMQNKDMLGQNRLPWQTGAACH